MSVGEGEALADGRSGGLLGERVGEMGPAASGCELRGLFGGHCGVRGGRVVRMLEGWSCGAIVEELLLLLPSLCDDVVAR